MFDLLVFLGLIGLIGLIGVVGVVGFWCFGDWVVGGYKKRRFAGFFWLLRVLTGCARKSAIFSGCSFE